MEAEGFENSGSVLPEDIINKEILIRLPAKIIVGFRLVCKSWKSLFTTSEFVKSHLTHQQSCKDQEDLLIAKKKDHGICIISRSSDIQDIAVQRRSHRLLGSIDGLVCMATGDELILWNPAIAQSKTICLPSQRDCGHQILGFSWDHVRNDYKVVTVCFVPNSSSRHHHIYSSNSDNWIDIKFHSSRLHRQNYRIVTPSTIVKGLPYWSYSTSRLPKGTLRVVKFVAENNELRSLPDFTVEGKKFSLVNVNDCLVGMMYKRGCPDSLVDIYSLDKESRSGIWSKMYTIGPVNLCSQDWWLLQCFKNSGEILIVDLGELHVYDPKTKETKSVMSISTDLSKLSKCFSYTPSLVWVQGMKLMHEFSKDGVIREIEKLTLMG